MLKVIPKLITGTLKVIPKSVNLVLIICLAFEKKSYYYILSTSI